MGVEMLEHADRRSLAGRSDGARYQTRRSILIRERSKEGADGGLSFALQDAIDRAFAMSEQRISDEGRTMTADKHRAAGEEPFGEFGQIYDFGYVCQIIARKADGVGALFTKQADVIAGRLRLQIEQRHAVTERSCR